LNCRGISRDKKTLPWQGNYRDEEVFRPGAFDVRDQAGMPETVLTRGRWGHQSRRGELQSRAAESITRRIAIG